MDGNSQEVTDHTVIPKKHQKSYRKLKYMQKDQRKEQRKRIFGQHYNYDCVKLNPRKKFMKQEQYNTEIQRSNRILLQKIQTIFKRSLTKRKHQSKTQISEAILPKQRINTEVYRYCDKPNISKIEASNQKSGVRVLLFKGKKIIGNRQCSLTIFIQQSKYTILSQHNKLQQKIQMPILQYQQFLKRTLKGDHKKILEYLEINKNGYLQIIGNHNIAIQLIQHGQIKLPNISRNDN